MTETTLPPGFGDELKEAGVTRRHSACRIGTESFDSKAVLIRIIDRASFRSSGWIVVRQTATGELTSPAPPRQVRPVNARLGPPCAASQHRVATITGRRGFNPAACCVWERTVTITPRKFAAWESGSGVKSASHIRRMTPCASIPCSSPGRRTFGLMFRARS